MRQQSPMVILFVGISEILLNKPFVITFTNLPFTFLLSTFCCPKFTILNTSDFKWIYLSVYKIKHSIELSIPEILSTTSDY